MPAKPKRRSISEPCRIGQTLDLLGGRWKGSILWWLQSGPKRFGELQRLLDEITPKVLTGQLRALERNGLVKRVQYPEIPPRVEYSLTPLCHSLTPLLDTITAWGDAHMPSVLRARKRFDG
jgi:DNA-binding HxlR family transcriptional regulator